MYISTPNIHLDKSNHICINQTNTPLGQKAYSAKSDKLLHVRIVCWIKCNTAFFCITSLLIIADFIYDYFLHCNAENCADVYKFMSQCYFNWHREHLVTIVVTGVASQCQHHKLLCDSCRKETNSKAATQFQGHGMETHTHQQNYSSDWECWTRSGSWTYQFIMRSWKNLK